jgi:hypothetical protein
MATKKKTKAVSKTRRAASDVDDDENPKPGRCKRLPVGHCTNYVKPTDPAAGNRCRRAACGHPLEAHLAHLPK